LTTAGRFAKQVVSVARWAVIRKSRSMPAAVAAVAILVSGCSYQIQMMSRDTGRIYTGTGVGNGFGSGSMTIVIDDRTYTGPMVRTATSDSFGFVQQFGGGICLDDNSRIYDVVITMN
jgi:hypothetical protein